MNTIFKRKSVRLYSKEKLSVEELNLLVKAGMQAPSANNSQPWAFVVVTDEELLQKLGDAMPFAKMIKKAPAAIVVLGDANKSLPGEIVDYWVVDCAAASENILLQAEDMGLGAVWTAVFPESERMKDVASILNIPSNFMPFNIIPVGHIIKEQKAHENYKEENVFYNKF